MSKKKTPKNRDNLRRSGFEPQIEKLLKHEAREFKYKIEYESEAFDVLIPVKYIPDFKLSNDEGDELFIECKGFFDDQDKRKILNFTKQNPNLDFHIVFQRNNAVRKGSKIRYTDWCEKHGISCSVGKIPDEVLRKVFKDDD